MSPLTVIPPVEEVTRTLPPAPPAPPLHPLHQELAPPPPPNARKYPVETLLSAAIVMLPAAVPALPLLQHTVAAAPPVPDTSMPCVVIVPALEPMVTEPLVF